MRSTRTIVLLCFISSLTAGAQSDIKRRDQQLKRLRAEIQQYEQKLQQTDKKEKVTLDRLDTIEKKANLVRELLAELRREEKNIRTSIDTSLLNITMLERQLDFLRSHYAQYVASVYKYGKVYDFETLLSSNSINQLYIRIEYLQRFSRQRQKDLAKIIAKKEQLEFEHSALQEKLSTEQQLISDKLKEEYTLNKTKDQRKRALTDIRRDKTQIKRELDRKVTAAKQLENLIATLIEQERIRKEKAEREARERRERIARERAAQRERERQAQLQRERDLAELKKKNDLQKAQEKEREIELARKREEEREREYILEDAKIEIDFRPLSERKGKLIWPVIGGKVVAEFGNQIHPVMKTITTNTGIDISTKDESPVRVIADGEIALIHWLPSYGNLVIVNHGHGYRTVYAHLDEIFVVQGQKIKEGTIIARSGSSVSGDLVHFELWEEKEKQNPREWLARR
jgi:septal ring factor EnvC (AmiA/AmiB activator)